jgi:molybdopterin-guanine dinucleotide biosynthesis protein A
MPFLNVELLRYLVKLSPGFDAVVPRTGKVQPLHAVYSRACVDAMKVQVEDDRLKITWFLDAVNVRYVEQAECQDFDPRLLSFFNINSRAELARANTLIEESASLGNRDKL